MNLRIVVSPHGRLLCESVLDAADVGTSDVAGVDAIRQSFEVSSAEGLLNLVAAHAGDALPPDLLFWRDWGRRFFDALSQLDQEQLAAFSTSRRTKSRDAVEDRNASSSLAVPLPPDDLALAVLISEAPPMRGLEYLTPDVFKRLWQELALLASHRAAETDGGLPAFLRAVNPQRHLLGRVTFHLAENKRDSNRPACLLWPTYAHRMSAKANIQHLPLGSGG